MHPGTGGSGCNSRLADMKQLFIIVMFCSAYANGMLADVSVTKYGPTGSAMANGEQPHVGAVAVSDRAIPLGTKVVIDSVEYVVKDRTAKWVHERNGLTVDIYSEETNEKMLEFGKQRKTVQFLPNI